MITLSYLTNIRRQLNLETRKTWKSHESPMDRENSWIFFGIEEKLEIVQFHLSLISKN